MWKSAAFDVREQWVASFHNAFISCRARLEGEVRTPRKPAPTTKAANKAGSGAKPGARSDQVQSLVRALAIINGLAASDEGATLTEVAQQVGLSPSTAHRLLNVLVDSGYLQRVNDQYCLSDRLFELGNQTRLARPNGVRERAMPFMAELFAQTRQTIHLAVLSGTDVLYLEKLFGHDSLRLRTAVGRRRPAYATALGKALLAFAEQEPAEWSRRIRYRRYTAHTITNPELMNQSLSRVHDEGFATESEESMLGVACMAVPILNRHNDKAIAALSLSTSVANASAHRYKQALAKAAEQLSAQLTPHASDLPA